MADFTNDTDAGARRARLRPKPAAIDQIYGNGLLKPLRATNGMVWPYQPTITYQQDVTYTNIDLIHVNQEMYAYTRTNALKFTVDGQFSVQNQSEGLYALACLHYMRTVTKMWFGQNDANAGTPPPVLLFDAYGQYMFNQLPVIVTSFSVTLPNDIDYVPVDLANASASSGYTAGQATTPSLTSFAKLANLTDMSAQVNQQDLNSGAGYIWLPAVFNINVSMTVQNTPSRLRQFNLDAFRSGSLMQGGGWI